MPGWWSNKIQQQNEQFWSFKWYQNRGSQHTGYWENNRCSRCCHNFRLQGHRLILDFIDYMPLPGENNQSSQTTGLGGGLALSPLFARSVVYKVRRVDR